MDFEGLTVTLRSEQDRGDYVIRKMEVINVTGPRMTMQGYRASPYKS